MKEYTIYLAFGSNLGNRHQNIHNAIRLLKQKIRFESFSFLYETDPVGFVDQPRFLNAAAKGYTALSPEELLDFCEAVMAQLGRVRTIVMGPRMIDIDIIFYGSLVITTERLVLPHPRVHERAFVLQPLCDFDPHIEHPVLRKSVEELLSYQNESLIRVTPVGNKLLYYSNRTYVMGIMNATPDSFSQDGLALKDETEVLIRLEELKDADLIDIGGMSSRPGHQLISEEDEIDRLQPIIHLAKSNTLVPISIDTFRASVARFALEHGADMINSVWGGEYDQELLSVVARYEVPIVLMQNQMKTDYFSTKKTIQSIVDQALSAGIYPWNIILDPGIGFVQKQEDNKILIQSIPQLSELGYLILVGASRKKFLRNIVGKENNNELVAANIASHVYLASLGAQIIRVHDVAEAVDGMRIFDTLRA